MYFLLEESEQIDSGEECGTSRKRTSIEITAWLAAEFEVPVDVNSSQLFPSSRLMVNSEKHKQTYVMVFDRGKFMVRSSRTLFVHPTLVQR